MATTNLNITTANFGNDDDLFVINSPAVYLDFHDASGLIGIGYLEAEKTFRATLEWAMFKEGIPKSEIRRDVIDQSFEIEGMLKQFQAETMALALNRRYDSEDATWNRVIIGSDMPDFENPSMVLVGETVNKNELRLYVRKIQISTETVEIMMGAGEYASIPFKAVALKDEAPLTTNPTWPYNATYSTQDNIAFWAWPKADSSS